MSHSRTVRGPDEVISIHSVASKIGIGVNTLKRFLEWNPELKKMVKKTKGGHWRINASQENVTKLRHSLQIWRFWSRKGIDRPFVRTRKRKLIRRSRIEQKATRTHERQDELEKIKWDFICFQETGWILSETDYCRYRDLALEPEPKDASENPFKVPEKIESGLLNDAGVDWKYTIFMLAVSKLQQRLARSISVRDLAEEMRVSRATL